MTIKEIYDLSVLLGVNSDLRGEGVVRRGLQRVISAYEKMPENKRRYYDIEKLTNPYSDARILVGDYGAPVAKVLAGIDIDGSELLLARELGGIDLVIEHHPSGRALADLHSVMHLQAGVLNGYGVPINIAESVLKPRIAEVGRKIHPINHDRSSDFARLLGMNLMCVHTPADNLGARFLVDLVNETKPELVEDVLNTLLTLPEYDRAARRCSGPRLFHGDEENSCGRVAVSEFTGGTEGAKEIYEKMSQAGVGTIIGMHLSEEHLAEAKKHHLNVVIAGHMASDSLGMNLLLDEVEKRGVQVLTCSGLDRVKRQMN